MTSLVRPLCMRPAPPVLRAGFTWGRRSCHARLLGQPKSLRHAFPQPARLMWHDRLVHGMCLQQYTKHAQCVCAAAPLGQCIWSRLVWQLSFGEHWRQYSPSATIVALDGFNLCAVGRLQQVQDDWYCSAHADQAPQAASSRAAWWA